MLCDWGSITYGGGGGVQTEKIRSISKIERPSGCRNATTTIFPLMQNAIDAIFPSYFNTCALEGGY